MATAFTVKYYMYTIGTADFLNAFFSTVCGRLENGKWGSRFPHLMNELYQGVLPVKHLAAGTEELSQIKQELAQFAPDQVILTTARSLRRGATISARILPTSAITLSPARERIFSRYSQLRWTRRSNGTHR